MYGRVYKITCLPTGKVYVGQTVQELHLRFNAHCHFKRKGAISAITLAIQKHGRKQFSIETLAFANCQEELNTLEIYWIGRLNSLSPNGYNLGLGGVGGRHSRETRQKISDVQRGKKTGPRSLEFRVLISKLMMGLGNHRFGVRDSEETRLKKSIAHKVNGKSGVHTRIPIRCKETGVVYESTIDASRKLGIDQKTIWLLLNSGKTARKHKLSFERLGKGVPSQ